MPLFETIHSLFIHIPRTGGTHLERLLSLNVRWPESAIEKLFGPHRQNGRYFVLQHLTAEEILRHGFVPPERYARLFKFSVVRDPYQRCGSLYYYWKAAKGFENFEAFLDFLSRLNLNGIRPGNGHADDAYHFLPQVNYLCDAEGSLLVDRVLRFEHFREEVDELLARVGIGTDEPLFDREVREKRSMRYLAIYNRTTREMVQNIYGRDFETFGYPVLPAGGAGDALSIPRQMAAYRVTDRGDRVIFEDSSHSFHMNRWAYLIWSLCDNHRSIGAIQRLLQEAFPENGEHVPMDLRAVIKLLVKLGALRLE